MRPCAMSSSCIDGMLESTLVVRRFDQNPSRISTEWTGTVLSFANREPERSMIPALFQVLAAVSETGDAAITWSALARGALA